MAITWGGSITSGQNGMRVGIDITQSPATVGAGTSSVTITTKIYIWTRRSVVDSSNTFSWSGSFGSGSQAVNINHTSATSWSTSNQTLVKTLTRTVSPSYTATTASSISAQLTGINAVPGTASHSRSLSTGIRPPGKPDAPTAMSATRVSDTQYNLTWSNTNPTTASKKYANLVVQRQEKDGTWGTIATLGATATSYADKSTKIDSKYRWRVAAKNAAGTSAYSTSGQLWTTPKAPGKPTLSKSGGSVTLNFANTAFDPRGIKVYDSPNGTTWTLRATVAGNKLTSWVDNSPKVTLVYYAVTNTISTLESAKSPASAGLQIENPPLNPYGYTPQNGSAQVADDPMEFTWKHRPVDSSSQTAYELRVRQNGGAWVVYTGTTAEFRVLPGGTLTNGNTIDWQVRTKGAHPSFGAWSNLYSFRTSARPIATIDDSDPQWGTLSKLTAVWSYYDEEGTAQSGWEAQLMNGSTVLESRSGVNGSSTVFATPMKNGTTRTLRVRVKDGDGLWSGWDSVSITTTYFPPPTPTLDGEFNEDDFTVSLSIDNSEPTSDVITYGWAGTPHLSESIKYLNGVEVERNIATNPSAEVDSNGWGRETGVSVVEHSTVTQGVAVGTGCIQVTGAASGLTLINTAARIYVSGSTRIPIPNDTSYLGMAFSAVGTQGQSLSTQMVAYWYSDTGGYLGATSSAIGYMNDDQNNLTTNRFVRALSPWAGAVTVIPIIRFRDHDGVNIAPAGFTAFIDAAQLSFGDTAEEAMSKLTEYFDGDMSPEGEVDTEYNNVYRYLGDGQFELIEGNVPVNGSVLDPIPVYGIDAVNYYIVEAVSATPSSALSEILAVESGEIQGCEEWIWLNAGAGFSTKAKLRGNPAVEIDRGRSKVLRRFVGRELPVEFMSDDISHVLKVSGSIEGKEEFNRERDFVAVNHAGAPSVYRDFWGRRIYMSMGDVGLTQLAMRYMDVSFQIEQVAQTDLEPVDFGLENLPDSPEEGEEA